MTRKDFQMIAETLKAYRGILDDDILDDMAWGFAYRLADTNPRFDSDLFFKATR